MLHTPTLLLPEKTDTELEQVATAWAEQGGIVQKLGKYWIKDERLAQQKLAVYGNQTFALILAQLYKLELISPNEEFIAQLEAIWTKRKIQQLTVNEVNTLIFPIFIKPIIPKLFAAKVYETLAEFSSLSIPQGEQILVANVVDIEAEARSFIYNAEIQDFAIYSGAANLEIGRIFLQAFLAAYAQQIPKSLVIDLAYNAQLGWFVLEFNASWGAGLNGCNAQKVLPAIINATQNLTTE